MSPWRSKISLAGTAEVEDALLGYASGDISCSGDTLETHVGTSRSRWERGTTDTT